jgi:hypothetical protein
LSARRAFAAARFKMQPPKFLLSRTTASKRPVRVFPVAHNGQ